MVEEELDKVQDDQEREEGVQVDVEREAPLNVHLAASEKEVTGNFHKHMYYFLSLDHFMTILPWFHIAKVAKAS